jgi:hypothetical protein
MEKDNTFFHLNFQKSFIHYKSWGGNMTTLKLRGQPATDLVLSNAENAEIRDMPTGWPSNEETKTS